MLCGAGNSGAQEWLKSADTRIPNVGFLLAGNVLGESNKFNPQTEHHFATVNTHCSYTRRSQFEPGTYISPVSQAPEFDGWIDWLFDSEFI